MPTRIAWTSETWNPITGCTPVSEGCAHCYAAAMARRFHRPFNVTIHMDRWRKPETWAAPRRVFVCSMGDLFHADVPAADLYRVLGVIQRCRQHTFQVLTKRPERMMRTINSIRHRGAIPNLWLGVTAENQRRADERIPVLLQTRAAVRFLSLEPLLEPVDISKWLPSVSAPGGPPPIHWVIVGCESGPGRRKMARAWARSVIDQCAAAGVAVFVKQIEVDGRVSHHPDEWPPDLRRQEFPDEEP